MTTILTTTDHSTAILCGYDGPVDPRADSEGLEINHFVTKLAFCNASDTPNTVLTFLHSLDILDGQSSISLSGLAEIRQVAEALTRLVKQIEAKS